MRHCLLLLVCAGGCSDGPAKEPADRAAATTSTDGPGWSGGGDSDDSGRAPGGLLDGEADVRGSVAAELRGGTARACSDPTQRTTEGPFHHIDDAFDVVGEPAMPDGPVGSGVTAADLDADGHLDVLLVRYEGVYLFLGDGAGGLTHASDRLPEVADPSPNLAASVAADFDADGDLDIVLANRGGPDELWWNDGSGHFTRDGEAPFASAARASVGVSAADVDGDGDLDLFFAGHSDRGVGAGADASGLYLWNGYGFEAHSSALPAETEAGFTFQGTWFDGDQDGDLDLLLVNDHGHVALPNQMLENQSSVGGVSLVRWPEAGLDATMLAMGVALADFNDDTRPDLLITNFGQLSLFESLDDNTWFDSAVARGLIQDADTQVVGWSVVAEDLDNDADLDVWATFGAIPESATSMANPFAQPDALWEQTEGGFVERAAAWGVDDDAVGRGGLAVDLNEDGWLDIITAPLITMPRVHLSRCGAESWLQVDLEAPGANPAAVGAVVEVRAAGRAHRRWVVAGGTQMYGSPPATVHVGLGSASEAQAVVVRWPDGETSVVGPVRVNQKVTVVRTE